MTLPATVVIGAGVVGCLVARELVAANPVASVTVVDRDAVGAGASRRSAGLHLPRGSTPRVRQMAAYSHAYYARLLDRCPELPIHPVSAVVVSAAAGGEAGLAGGGYLDLTAPRPAEHLAVPGLQLADTPAAWRIAGAHYTDVGRFCEAIATGLRPVVRFREGVAVTRLEAIGDAVIVHVGTGEPITAGQVVLAPGPWLADPAWQDLVAPLRLRVKKIVALHIEKQPGAADEVVVFDDEDAFLLPVSSRGHWLFSYTCTEWDVDPDALAGGVSAANLGAARDCLRRYSPALAAACHSGRVFCDAYSPDGEPVVQALDASGRIVFAGAANGSGYRLAPAIASQAIDLLHLTRSEGATGDYQYV